MATVSLKKRYEPLRKKYKLPSFEELNSSFEIGEIEPEIFSIKEIRKQIAERMEHVSEILECPLQPEPTLSDLYESRVFSELEKKDLFALYKRLKVAGRRISELFILNDEMLDAEFIRSFSAEWQKLKPKILGFIKKIREAWEADVDEDESVQYMG